MYRLIRLIVAGVGLSLLLGLILWAVYHPY
jgi:hypothetical protein